MDGEAEARSVVWVWGVSVSETACLCCYLCERSDRGPFVVTTVRGEARRLCLGCAEGAAQAFANAPPVLQGIVVGDAEWVDLDAPEGKAN